jgi:type III pantothenate kinase
MLLAIDVGNTNTVFAVFRGDELVTEWRLSTQARRTADEYGMWLRQLMRECDGISQSLTGTIIATVVPETQFELMMLCRRYFAIEPLLVGANTLRMNIRVEVEHPEEVGADRLVNAVEAWRRYQCGLVVIDFGTATTFDVVSNEGAYIGGVIAPGVNLSLTALQQAAAKLPSIRVRAPEKVIGRNTIAAMESGIYYGYASMIEGVLLRIRAEQPDLHKVLATGGLAPLYARTIPAIDETLPDLTIFGLKTLFEMNNADTHRYRNFCDRSN